MKHLKLPTNLNSKIGCTCVIHIMHPARGKIDSQAFNEPVEMSCEDKSCVYMLNDYVRQRMKDVPPHIFQQSHGLYTKDEFYAFMYKHHGLHPNDFVGVYFFWIDTGK